MTSVEDQQTLENTFQNRSVGLSTTSESGVQHQSKNPKSKSVKRVRMEASVHSNKAQSQQKSTSSSSETKPLQSIQAMAYTCPQLKCASVQRMSLESLLSSDHIVIPLMQRAYCWSTETTVVGWWRDSAKGSNHSIGKAVYQHHDGAWICLDGQQRVTTSMLLVAAAVHALERLSIDKENARRSAQLLRSVLFVDTIEAQQWLDKHESSDDIAAGERLSFVRLEPSFVDRKPFYELLLQNNRNDDWLNATTPQSKQFDTKRYFDRQFDHLLKQSDENDAVECIMRRTGSALSMQHMMVELTQDSNMAQCYQWLQEKSLLSMGALLHNPTPGVVMHAGDLVRNLFLSPWMNERLDVQETAYNEHWLPLELACHGRPRCIDAALDVRLQQDESLPKCAVEQQIEQMTQMLRACPRLSLDFRGITLFARLLSLWQHSIALETTGADANDDVVVNVQKEIARKLSRQLSAIAGQLFPTSSQ